VGSGPGRGGGWMVGSHTTIEKYFLLFLPGGREGLPMSLSVPTRRGGRLFHNIQKSSIVFSRHNDHIHSSKMSSARARRGAI
jgi:hypothetical protein